MPRKKVLKFVAILLVLIMSLTTVGAFAQDGDAVTFLSTQFNRVEETEKAVVILEGYGDVEFIPSEETPFIDTLVAEKGEEMGTIDLVGALHGTFPVLAAEDVLFDLTDLLAGIEEESDVADAFVELGLLNTEDYQYYIPWMQATYIMAAHVDALEYLPEGADLNALTWDEVLAWAQALNDAMGSPAFAIPAGEGALLHRFMQGYAYPSFTGSMVTGFQSEEAVAMFEYLRELWAVSNPQAITYDNMSDPLLSGEVMLTWDHTARIKPALDESPEDFVVFPAPAGPAGRGFMPVVVGLGIPFNSPNPEGAADLLRYMLGSETQAAVLAELGFFPVISGVDVSELPESVAAEAAAVEAQATSDDALPALLPVGLGERGGDFNTIYRDTFRRIVIDGEDIVTVLGEESANVQAILDETGAACWPPDAPSEGACQVAE